MRNSSQLLIPPRLRVGFNERENTYTGRLAFVIYYDVAGVLRQERSWETWRDKGIEPVEFPNEPTEGFVLNKSVGGVRESYSRYHARNEYVRVYDPRNWEFEISVANLLFILQEGVCHPGKGLEGSFVYAWDKTKPVLLPVTSQDYKNCVIFTGLKTQNLRMRDLVPGRTYLTKKQDHWVYLGRFDYLYAVGGHWTRQKDDPGCVQKLVFAEQVDGQWVLRYKNNADALASEISSEQVDNLAELIELHTRSIRGSPIASLFTKPKTDENPSWRYRHVDWYTELPNGQFARMGTEYREGVAVETYLRNVFENKNGILHVQNQQDAAWARNPNYRAPNWGGQERSAPASPHPWREPVFCDLCAKLECGTEVVIDYWKLGKDI